MRDNFDIFRVDTGGVRWLESAATLDDAKARIPQLAALQNGQYLVLNQLTGAKIVFNSEGDSTEFTQSSPSNYERAARMGS